jgi:acylphosphatase
MQWYRFIVNGKVQGVYFRKFVAEAMRRAGFKGYIRNLPDGSVEAVVFLYDADEELPQVMRILQEGSPMSETEHIAYDTVEDVDFSFEGFEIRY